jgi:hypothetical protein
MCIDSNIIAEPYHLHVKTKVLHEFVFNSEVLFRSRRSHFRGAGAVTRFKLAKCNIGVKLL